MIQPITLVKEVFLKETFRGLVKTGQEGDGTQGADQAKSQPHHSGSSGVPSMP